jgi:hypothetical protein
MKSVTSVLVVVMTALGLASVLLAILGSSAAPRAMAIPLASSTPTYCPLATPEPFWVDPVTSPTGQFSQVVTVHLGNGEAVTVIAESGTFAASGPIGAYSHPASVTVALLTDTRHHLEVFGKVRLVKHDGCAYGDYTLRTDRDKFGAPLVIVQRFNLTRTFHLPLVFRRCCSGG